MRDLRVFNDTVHSRFLGSLGGDWSRLPSLDAVVWMLMLSTMSGSAMRSASSSSGFMEGGDGGAVGRKYIQNRADLRACMGQVEN